MIQQLEVKKFSMDKLSWNTFSPMIGDMVSYNGLSYKVSRSEYVDLLSSGYLVLKLV